jgi:hypothetical protein
VHTYTSIWQDKDLRRQVEQRVGHSLRLQESLIEHPDAGRGVFVSCRRQGVVLPGTLLGVFPGVIFDPAIPPPPTPKHSLRPYLQRFDGYWLDYEKELPYPMPAPGANFEDLFFQWHEICEQRGITHKHFVQVAPEMLNPYALGHFINHAPPSSQANCHLIDFDLPYTFFPTVFSRYIPYINFRENPKEKKSSATRTS